MEILCAANCWTLKYPLPFSIFCTLGFVVISLLLSLFHSSLHKGSVLTLWDWDCKIRMEMCEMETSVYHFAISTLHCSFLPAIKTLSYAFICWFAFIFIFIISWVLECFLKAGRAAEFLLPCLYLEHSCSRSQKRGTEEGIEVGLRSQGCAVVLCQQWAVLCAQGGIPTCWLWEQKNSGESKAKCDTTRGSSHHLTPCIPCDWGLNCSATLSLNYSVGSHTTGRTAYSEVK